MKSTKHGRFITVRVDPRIVRRVTEGGSVSVDGVCLTRLTIRHPEERSDEGSRTNVRRSHSRKILRSAQNDRSLLYFELMDSTLKRTTLGARRVGDVVNVEPAVLLGQPIGGHFISGHVDGVGRVHRVAERWHTRYIVMNVPRALHRYLVPQGSVVVNGVSLTIVEVVTLRQAQGIKHIVPERRRTKRAEVEGQAWFSVALTSYTLKHTNLGDLKMGDKVNIEVDMLAKYLEKFLNRSKTSKTSKTGKTSY